MSVILVRFLDSVYLREARLCVRRARRARTEGNAVRHGGATFSAIVAATAATEAYLSELLAHLADVRVLSKDEREKIRKKAHLWEKYNALAKLFGSGIDGLPVYRPYQALVTLRNTLIHRNAEFIEPGTWPEKLSKFRDVIPHVSGTTLDWNSQVLDADTAHWAADSAWQFLTEVDSYIPDPARFPGASGGRGGQ